MTPRIGNPMYTVTWKSTARWDRPTPAGARIIAALDRTASVCRTNLHITSGTDGAHGGPTDPHARGEAFDVSVIGMDPFLIVQVHQYLAQLLGPLFTVLYEAPTPPADARLKEIVYVNRDATAPHFHLQPKKGSTWPPMQPSGTAPGGAA